MSLSRAAEAFTHALREDDPVALYENAPCGYLSTTPDGMVIKVNGTFLRWTGHRESDVVGHPIIDLLSPGARVYHETHYAPMLRLQGFVRELAVDVLRPDGSRLPVLLNATLAKDPAGEPQVIRVAVFDATERRRYEQELLRSTEAAQAAQVDAEAAEHRSRALVDTLQLTLVPGALPQVDGLQMHGVFQPAGSGAQVGGDFYDVWSTGPEECWVVLGDVSGKGVEAAVVTSVIRNSARALTLTHDHPQQILVDLNTLLLAHETDRYCTAVVGRLCRSQAGTWQLTYGSAGHPPIVAVQNTGEPWMLPAGGQVLGLFPDAEPEVHDVALTAGQTLLLYTDGVTEGRQGSALFGDERLLEAVAAAPRHPRGVVETVLAEVLDFQDGLPRDDIACLGIGTTPEVGT